MCDGSGGPGPALARRTRAGHKGGRLIALLSPLTYRMGLTRPIDLQQAHDIIAGFSVAFFDRELKARTAALLGRPAERFPEVPFATRRA